MRISYQEIYDNLLRVLRKISFAIDRAELCARLFADTVFLGQSVKRSLS